MGLAEHNSCSGMPAVFAVDFSAICFLFLLRRFMWCAVSAKATEPSAVANSTFFRLGVRRSCEKIDWEREEWVRASETLTLESLFSLLYCVYRSQRL